MQPSTLAATHVVPTRHGAADHTLVILHGIYGRGRNWQGNDNGVEYTPPTWGGFSATVQTGLGEQTDGFTKLRKDGISVSYIAPSFEVRAIYDVARDKNGKYTELFNTSKELTLGGTATLFEDLKMFAGYQRLSVKHCVICGRE